MNEGKLTLFLLVVSIMLIIVSCMSMMQGRENKELKKQIQALQAK
jgi:hypothetical protein